MSDRHIFVGLGEYAIRKAKEVASFVPNSKYFGIDEWVYAPVEHSHAIYVRGMKMEDYYSSLRPEIRNWNQNRMGYFSKCNVTYWSRSDIRMIYEWRARKLINERKPDNILCKELSDLSDKDQIHLIVPSCDRVALSIAFFIGWDIKKYYNQHNLNISVFANVILPDTMIYNFGSMVELHYDYAISCAFIKELICITEICNGTLHDNTDLSCDDFNLSHSGTYGYPKSQALRLAVDVISGFLSHNDISVYLVVYDRASYIISEGLFADISSYIDDKYVDTHADFRNRRAERLDNLSSTCSRSSSFYSTGESAALSCEEDDEVFSDSSIMPPCRAPQKSEALSDKCSLSLDDMINQIDESFSQMLLRKIDEKGITDAECYKKANIDRKLFSKIRSDVNYKPSKNTAIAFAISLELTLTETKDMLMKAGYALSRSNKFDIIIEYFITNGIYNVFEINEALFAFDQSLLGV